MTHTITVTRAIDTPGADGEDPIYTIGGTHDHTCEAWVECDKGWHRHPKNEFGEMDEWSTKRVPQEHQWIGGMWMVPMLNRCGLDLSFEYDNPEFQMTEVGTYRVDVEWDGDYWTAALGRPESSGSEPGGES